MKIDVHDSRLFVPAEGLIAIRDGTCTRITCHAGLFWVTQEGRLRDDILKPGETLVVRERGSTIVTALAAGEISLTDAALPAHSVARSWFRRLLPAAQAPAAC